MTVLAHTNPLVATVRLYGKAEAAGPVLYSVSVHDQAGGERPALLKRYSEFEALHEALLAARTTLGGREPPCLPEKHLFGLGLWRHYEEAYAERARGLEAYLAQLLSDVTLVESSAEETIAIADFLKIDLLDLASKFLAAASPTPTSLGEEQADEACHASTSCPPCSPKTPLCHRGMPEPIELSTRAGGSSRAHGVFSALQFVVKTWSSLLWLVLLFIYICFAVLLHTISHVTYLVANGARARLLKWNREARSALEVRAPPVARMLAALQAVYAAQALNGSRSPSRSGLAASASASTPPRSAVGAVELLDLRAAVVDVVVPVASYVHGTARSILGAAAADRLAGLAAMVLAGSFASIFPSSIIEILSDLRTRSEGAASASASRGSSANAHPSHSSRPCSPLPLRAIEAPSAAPPLPSAPLTSTAVPGSPPVMAPVAAPATASRSLADAFGAAEATPSLDSPDAIKSNASSSAAFGPAKMAGSSDSVPMKLSCLEMRDLCSRVGAEGEKDVLGNGVGCNEPAPSSTVTLSSMSGRSTPSHTHSSPVELTSS